MKIPKGECLQNVSLYLHYPQKEKKKKLTEHNANCKNNS